MDPVPSHYTSQEGQATAVPEVPNDQPHWPPKQSHTEDHTEQIEATSEEEQAGFRAGRSTTEQIFNLRNHCEKYLQHQQDTYHVFIDFKKALL